MGGGDRELDEEGGMRERGGRRKGSVRGWNRVCLRWFKFCKVSIEV